MDVSNVSINFNPTCIHFANVTQRKFHIYCTLINIKIDYAETSSSASTLATVTPVYGIRTFIFVVKCFCFFFLLLNDNKLSGVGILYLDMNAPES